MRRPDHAPAGLLVSSLRIAGLPIASLRIAQLRIARFRIAGLLLAGLAAPALAAETQTFTYDALGRVITTQRSGGPTNGAATAVTYDSAGNRTKVTVTGSPAGSGNGQGGGATVAAATTWVVLPVSGFALVLVAR